MGFFWQFTVPSVSGRKELIIGSSLKGFGKWESISGLSMQMMIRIYLFDACVVDEYGMRESYIQSDWTPDTNIHRHDAHEAEKLLSEKEFIHSRPDTKEDSDLLEIFKVDKEMLIRRLQDADESFVNFSRSALGLNAKAKFGKSRSFPLAELSQGRKLKPIKLENKQREVWSFPREDKSPAANQAPRLDRSDYLGRRSGEQAGDDETENDRSSALLRDDRENVPLNANAVAICHEEPVDRSEADNLNYSDIITKEIIDQGFILDSDVCLEETECHQVNHQISEGLEPRSTTDELNSSIDFNDLKSLPSKSLSTHMTLNPEKGETPDTVAEGVMLDGHSEKSNSDLYYVRHLLDQSGIAAGLSDVTWHASDQPFSPKLFEKVEACWPHERDQLTGLPDFYGCWHHRMLFDLVGEVLLEVYDMSLPYYPKPLSSSCHVRPFPMGSHIIEEISTRAGTLLNLKPEEKQSLDCIAAHDLYHDAAG
ncbi:hypothetical protein Sango_0463800 [Sesamum angolense]|uniref:DUF4378 domain-containing protein n=1 Tax=Sesamum angolense TaxID=2727404 RepID=A0AAE2C4L7_9LAMI|nr:hypothetical protein Sango_0463800 [Sesamum angolense]